MQTMSAAANAAGYLCIHGLLPLAQVRAQAAVKSSARSAAEVSSLPTKQPRSPRILYRKRRVYALPAAA